MDTVQVDDLDTPLVGKHPSINTGSPFVDRRAAKFNRFAEARADRSGSFEFFHTVKVQKGNISWEDLMCADPEYLEIEFELANLLLPYLERLILLENGTISPFGENSFNFVYFLIDFEDFIHFF